MMYKYPDNMRRIEEIAAKAKAEGKTYGEYVAATELPPMPMVMPRRKGRNPKCTKCGGEITNHGKGYRKLCDKCRSEAISKGTKEALEKSGEYYLAKCSRCGAEVLTKQPPSKRRNGKIFCKTCRKELKRERVREYRDRIKGKECKND